MNWTRIIVKTREMVASIMSKYDASHDFNHVERVVNLAKHIAKCENVIDEDKLQVIELAAYLHDVHDHKYVEKSDTALTPKRAIEEHLSSLEVPNQLIERVQFVVDNISFSKEVKRLKENTVLDINELPIELKVVQDSDRLDAIGAVGVARCLVFSGSKGRAIYLNEPTSQFKSPSEMVDWKITETPKPTVSTTDDSAIQHFYDKLFHLESMMKTETGKKLAKKRVDHMRVFVEDLYDEIYFEALESNLH
ncbi:predicted protein [Naegleria gruberi]|uniref:Predicted protein n=1 Tax=Naegleria gruberi TaxID=5762 RepID=D2VAR4_NAEGR|nr:uncharacterized protein NAEGRDRAFT_60501 [Naegleria gruberi]EFC46124.1 predicted protein [Naegleria gruberi]|eukprot:XP_002678868.1 predicted protein [Naegleria gruberi strain NEG-M]